MRIALSVAAALGAAVLAANADAQRAAARVLGPRRKRRARSKPRLASASSV
jgi:hypothetical protein